MLTSAKGAHPEEPRVARRLEGRAPLATRQTLGLAANSESIAVEIVRTLCGSIGLVAAVPLTTALAATLVSEAAVGADDHAHDSAVEEELDKPPSWDDFAPD